MDIKFHIGQQTDKNTENIATDLLTLTAKSCNIAPKYNQTNSGALGIGGAFVSDGWVSRAEVDGDVEVELTIEQIKVFFESLGFKWDVKNTKNLELKLDENGFTKYLTLIKDMYIDGAYDTAKSLLASSIKISTTLEAYVTGNVNFIGMDYTSNKTKFSGTSFKTVEDKPLICLGSTIKEANTDVTAKVESIDITIDRKLEGKNSLNSISTRVIRPSAKGEVSLSLQFNEFDKNSYVDAQNMLKNNTSYIVEVEFKEVETNRKVKIKFPIVKISNVELTDLEGAGGISKELKAYTPTGKDIPFEIIIENYTK